MPHRSGYIIPNASDGVNSLQAEPDAGDFSVLGNNNYGVLYGGLCTPGGGLSVNVAAGAFLVNGAIVVAPAGSVTLASHSGDPRFDLVGYNSEGMTCIQGVASSEPKFGFIPSGFVLLAAVLVAGDDVVIASDIVDKRHMLLNGVRGAVTGESVFSSNTDPDTGDVFQISGSGEIRWGLSPSSANISSDGTDITISGSINATGGIDVTGNSKVTGNFEVTGVAKSSNFQRGTGDPNSPLRAGNTGDIYTSLTTGQQYTRLSTNSWAEIYADEYPPGTIISSLLEGEFITSFMGQGWLQFGQTYEEELIGRLYNDQMGTQFSSWDNGDGTWTLPDLSNTFLMGGLVSGTAPVGTNKVTLGTANLPAHRHFNGVSNTLPSGSHSHAQSGMASAGLHSHDIGGGTHPHDIDDLGHFHRANPYGTNVPVSFVATVWGGDSKLDGLNADASHTWTVGAAGTTTVEPSRVSVRPGGGNHSHTMTPIGAHTHTLNIAQQSDHVHALPTEQSVGEGTEFDIMPKHLTVHYYLKV